MMSSHEDHQQLLRKSVATAVHEVFACLSMYGLASVQEQMAAWLVAEPRHSLTETAQPDPQLTRTSHCSGPLQAVPIAALNLHPTCVAQHSINLWDDLSPQECVIGGLSYVASSVLLDSLGVFNMRCSSRCDVDMCGSHSINVWDDLGPQKCVFGGFLMSKC